MAIISLLLLYLLLDPGMSIEGDLGSEDHQIHSLRRAYDESLPPFKAVAFNILIISQRLPFSPLILWKGVSCRETMETYQGNGFWSLWCCNVRLVLVILLCCESNIY